MALLVKKTITINGTSIIEDQPVVYMSASLSTEGSDNNTTSKYIQNRELYNAHRTEVRADMAAFDAAVFELEDQFASSDLEALLQQ